MCDHVVAGRPWTHHLPKRFALEMPVPEVLVVQRLGGLSGASVH